MGISYSGVGGIGIELTEELIEKFISKGYFTEDEWDDDYYECLETINQKLDIENSSAGNFYSDDNDDLRHYLFVDGENLKEILENYSSFIEKLKTVDIELSIEDLELVSDFSVF